MTQEEKSLLIKDLCARLPYGLMVRVLDINDPTYQKDGNLYNIKCLEGDYNGIPYLFDVDNQACLSDITEIQPYLRPLSSMTEEEKEEYCNLQDKFLCSSQYLVTDAYELFDWLNFHHFDYRGLIEKGLAIEALKGMY